MRLHLEVVFLWCITCRFDKNLVNIFYCNLKTFNSWNEKWCNYVSADYMKSNNFVNSFIFIWVTNMKARTKTHTHKLVRLVIDEHIMVQKQCTIYSRLTQFISKLMKWKWLKKFVRLRKITVRYWSMNTIRFVIVTHGNLKWWDTQKVVKQYC